MKTFKEYQESALCTAPSNTDKDHDLLHGVLGLITEAAEIADVIKKQHAYGKPLDRVNLKEELGDVLWYIPLLCRALDTDMESVAEMNIAKLKLRYPDKFNTKDATTRDLVAERELLETYD